MVIVGGGDSAVDWALLLEPIAKSVAVVHRRAASGRTRTRSRCCAQTSVRMITDAQVGRGASAIRVAEVGSPSPASSQELACDRLVAALGFIANLGPLLEWGLEIVQKRHIVVDTTMADLGARHVRRR